MTAPERDLDALLSRLVRDVPDFPEPGVLFKDICPLLADSEGFTAVVAALAAVGRGDDGAVGVDKVAGVEARDEGEMVSKLASGRGLVLLALGISISLDELAIGFTIGLLHLSLWLAVLLIGAQAFAFAQVGLRLGACLNDTFRERAEQLAGLALVALAGLLVVEKLA